MRPFRAALALVGLVALALLTAVTAAAGGPTSALLAVPSEGKTASLYYTDPEYDDLAQLVGAMDSAGAGTVDTSGRSHESGPGVTVTWLIHDVMPWRVDRIYPGDDGVPWISTQVGTETGSIWDGPVVWHQPASQADSAELVALLDRLGVGEASRVAAAKGNFTGVAGAPVTESIEPATEPQAAPAESSDVAGIWWGLGGLAGGVLLTLLFLRLRRGHMAEAVPEPAADADGAPPSEELAWGGRRG